MKKLAFVLLFLLLPTFAHGGDKTPNPANYTIKVHVTASYSRLYYGNGTSWRFQRLQATIDGKSVELETYATGVLPLGDYKARVIRTKGAPKPKDAGNSVYLTYEFLFPDGSVQPYDLTGYTTANETAATQP